MIKDIPMTVTYITELPKCWICKNGSEYILHPYILPMVNERYKEILEELNIPHKQVTIANNSIGYIYWNPDFYEEEKITLPAYVFMFKKYKYNGYHEDYIPTEETCRKAKEIEVKVKEKIKNEFTEEKIEFLTETLEGREAMYISAFTIKGWNIKEDEELKVGENHFYVFVIKRKDGRATGHVLIFDRNKIGNNKIVKLDNVPNEYAGYIIGQGGCNLKKIAKKMGVRKIEIV